MKVEMAAQPDGMNLTRIKTVLEIRELVHYASFAYQIDLAIIAIGITGAGKSTLLNTLAGKEVFRAAGGIKGCTKGVQKEIVKFQDRSVALIDTPGLLDPVTLDKASYFPRREESRSLKSAEHRVRSTFAGSSTQSW